MLKEDIHKKLGDIEGSLTEAVNSRNNTTTEIQELKKQIADTEAKIRSHNSPTLMLKHRLIKLSNKQPEQVSSVQESEVLAQAHKSISKIIMEEIVENTLAYEKTILNDLQAIELRGIVEESYARMRLDNSKIPALLQTIELTRQRLKTVTNIIKDLDGIGLDKLENTASDLVQDWRKLIEQFKTQSVHEILAIHGEHDTKDSHKVSKYLLCFEGDEKMTEKARRVTMKSGKTGDVLTAK